MVCIVREDSCPTVAVRVEMAVARAAALQVDFGADRLGRALEREHSSLLHRVRLRIAVEWQWRDRFVKLQS